MGERHSHSHQNGRDIYSGKLRRSGLCDPIGADILATWDKRYRTGVRWDSKSSAGNFFAWSFLWKIENPLPSCRSSKYVASKEIQAGLTEPHDISKVEIHQFDMYELRAFSTTDHIQVVKGERRDGKKDHDVANDAKLQVIVSDQVALEKRLLLRSKHMDA